jgi:hypothetical protein
MLPNVDRRPTHPNGVLPPEGVSPRLRDNLKPPSHMKGVGGAIIQPELPRNRRPRTTDAINRCDHM